MANPEYTEMDNVFRVDNEEIVLHENDKAECSREKRMKQHISDFISSSTMHGLRFCIDRVHLVRRIIWSLLMLTAMCLFVFVLIESAKLYYQRPFYTRMSTKRVKSLVFPAVSFCNMNLVRASLVNETVFFNKVSGSHDFSNITYEQAFGKAIHDIEKMLQTCYFVGKTCSAKDFTKYIDLEGNFCYTINSGKNGNEVKSVEASHFYGSLIMTFDVEHHDYSSESEDFGLYFSVHHQHELPTKGKMFYAAPGTHVQAKIAKRVIKNLPSPYETACQNRKLKYFKTYSLQNYWMEKLTDAVVKKCGCKDSTMPGAFKTCYLNVTMSCVWPVWATYMKSKTTACPVPCRQEMFRESISYTGFPSILASKKLAKARKLNGTPMENRQFIRENYLKVSMFYRDISYELIEQVPSYNFTAFLGTIGGLLSLFLGSSILTSMEFFDCITMLLYTRFFQNFMKKKSHTCA